MQATVTASLLNVRAAASLSAKKLGQVSRHTGLTVVAEHGSWLEVVFDREFAQVAVGQRVFVARQYVRIEPAPVISTQADGVDHLAPSTKLPVSGNYTKRKVAKAWNQFGAYLEKLSAEKSIDVGCSVAVLCVESSGKGFEPSNQHRMIIRFENHKFWHYWGQHNPDQFHQHFQFAKHKSWTGHKWRIDSQRPWQGFHGKQEDEWQAFEFAASLDLEAALHSISMGAPQVMGFNFRRLGYASVEQMFEAFSGDMAAQIQGLFDFCSTSMIAQLQRLDFVGFAQAYNGSGQKQKYGQWIENHYREFKLMVEQA